MNCPSRAPGYHHCQLHFMPPIVRYLASTALSITLGITINHLEWKVLDFAADKLWRFLPFLTLNGLGTVANLAMLTAMSAPIAMLSQSKAKWFGAITGFVAEAYIFFYWLFMSPPRPEFNYTVSNAFFSLLYIFLFAGVSQLWWKYIFLKVDTKG